MKELYHASIASSSRYSGAIGTRRSHILAGTTDGPGLADHAVPVGRWCHSLRKSVCVSMRPGSTLWCHLAAKSLEISTNGLIRSESRRRPVCPSIVPAQARDFTCSCKASTEHFEQCAEFALLRNRGLGALAVTVSSIRALRPSIQPHSWSP